MTGEDDLLLLRFFFKLHLLPKCIKHLGSLGNMIALHISGMPVKSCFKVSSQTRCATDAKIRGLILQHMGISGRKIGLMQVANKAHLILWYYSASSDALRATKYTLPSLVCWRA